MRRGGFFDCVVVTTSARQWEGSWERRILKGAVRVLGDKVRLSGTSIALGKSAR